MLAKLSSAGVALESSDIAHGAWRASSGSPVLRALAQNGEIYFQDEASQLVAELLGAQQSERILILFSPGGKKTLVADRADGAYIVATDVSRRRLATVANSVSSKN